MSPPPTDKLSVLIIQTCLAVFCVSRASAAEQGAVTVQKRFQLCPRGSTLTGQPALTAMDARSAVGCAVSCATTSGCGSYNFCPDDPSVATRCQLLADRNSPSCADLTSLSGSSCRHGYKDVSTTPAGVVCQNGGTPRATDTGQCDCLLQYAGDTCERYIRDCTEPYENGINDTTLNGAYFIQPADAPAPFLVLCDFEHGVTYPFRRAGTLSFNENYNTCVNGFGEDLTTATEPENFFIGLTNLYYLLHQAEYNNEVFVQWSGSGSGLVIFTNFSLGSSSNSFSISYNQAILDYSKGAATGFHTGMRFSASGNDVNGCAAAKGAPGWYDAGCQGPGVFSDQLVWMVNSVSQPLAWFDFNIARKSAFYDSPVQQSTN